MCSSSVSGSCRTISLGSGPQAAADKIKINESRTIFIRKSLRTPSCRDKPSGLSIAAHRTDLKVCPYGYGWNSFLYIESVSNTVDRFALRLVICSHLYLTGYAQAE